MPDAVTPPEPSLLSLFSRLNKPSSLITPRIACGQAVGQTTLANKEELVGDVKFGGNLGCSDPEVVEIKIPREGNKTKSSITTLESAWIHKGKIMPHQPDSLQ